MNLLQTSSRLIARTALQSSIKLTSAPLAVASSHSTRRHFAQTGAAAVPSLRTSRKQRARGITSTPVAEGEGQEASHASTDSTIIHEYPEEHEFAPDDLGK